MVVLVADPRSPWGIKAWLDTMPWLKPFVAVAGIDANGARDPEATGKIKIVSVIVVGDPVSNFQWVAYRPVTSLVVNAAGFLTIHSGNGPHTYGDVERLGDPTEYTSGNTTYLVYDAAHPWHYWRQPSTTHSESPTTRTISPAGMNSPRPTTRPRHPIPTPRRCRSRPRIR